MVAVVSCGMIAAVLTAFQLSFQKTLDQQIGFGSGHASYELDCGGGKQPASPCSKSAGNHDFDAVLAQPPGKQAWDVLRSADQLFRKDLALAHIRIYEQELFTMAKMLGQPPI
jgi:hypothetical protein